MLSNWEMPVRAAVIDVELPGPAGLVQCGVPAVECQIDGAGTRQLRVTAADIPPRSPLTVRVDLAVAAPERATLPWSAAWDLILGRSVPAVVAGVLAAFALLGLGLAWARRSREAEPGTPVLYEPPAGLGPVQTVFVAKEEPGDHALSASLLRLAERGLVELTALQHQKWRITNIGTPEQWQALDPVTAAAAEELGVSAPEGQFAADLTVSAGKRLIAAESAVSTAAATWSRGAGLIERSRGEAVGRIAVILMGLLAIGGFLGVIAPTMLGLPFAAFTLGGAALLGVGVGTGARRRDARCGPGLAGSSGCCPPRRARSASAFPRARICSWRTSPTRRRSASPTSGLRNIRPRRGRCLRCHIGIRSAAVALAGRHCSRQAAWRDSRWLSTPRSRPIAPPSRRPQAVADPLAAVVAAQSQAVLDKAIVDVLAVAENYPELKASANFLHLQQQLADTENQLAFARQYYNDAVSTLNKKVVTIPWMFVTGVAGVGKRDFYQAPAGQDAPPQVRF